LSADLGAVSLQNSASSDPIDRQSTLKESLDFTAREQAVLEALSRGHSNKAIARDLNVAENTIKVHVRGILRKLQVSNRTEAVILAQRLHLTNISTFISN
jgi:two-component system nitrate/nitrite response regulator NarL